ncbi:MULTISPECIES: GNAT family N-acetyltransferase [Sphingomonas]|uniref:GNAT family N-acetyltransferase n=1 Tax=Sphingomonas TaxID=13687 RepID=UPI0008336683|nr:GNAT family N-acetyltransferase [Sphingomonas sp. CCH10-B3]
MTVRLATNRERRVVTTALARAFADDPALAWIFPDPTLRARRLPGLFAMLFDEDEAHGVRLMTLGGEAVTLWRAPGHAETPPSTMLRSVLPMLLTFGLALGRGLAVSKAIEAHFPSHPFWYLHIAGCDPAYQGQGLGKAAVQAGIDRMGGSGLPLYLETATERNIGFYQALGFRVTNEWRVGSDGPVFWSMLNG